MLNKLPLFGLILSHLILKLLLKLSILMLEVNKFWKFQGQNLQNIQRKYLYPILFLLANTSHTIFLISFLIA